MNEQNSILKDAADDEIEEGEIIDDDDDEADKLEMISDGEIVDHEDDKIYTKKFKKNNSRRYDSFRNGNRSSRSNFSWRTSYLSNKKKHKFLTTTSPTKQLSISQRWEKENLQHTPTSSSRSATASKEKEEKMYKMISIDQSFMDDSSFKKKVLCEKYKNDPRHQFATSETEFVRFNAASIHDPSAALTLKPSQNHELSHDITQGEEEACFSPIAPIYELSKPVPLDEIPMPKEEDYHHFTQSYSTSESAAISQAFFNHSAPFQNNQQQPNLFFGADYNNAHQRFPSFSASMNPYSNSQFDHQRGYKSLPNNNFDQRYSPRFHNRNHGNQRYGTSSSYNNHYQHGFHPYYSNNNSYNNNGYNNSNYRGNGYNASFYQHPSSFGQSGPSDHPYRQRRRRKSGSEKRRGRGRI